MSILNQVLPGIREARTPFAIGALWVITAWIACSFVPTEVWNGEFFVMAGNQIGALPVEVVIGGAAFLTYLVGVLMQSMGTAVTRVVIPGILFLSTLGLLLIVVDFFLDALIAMLVIAMASLTIYSAIQNRRLALGNYWRTLEYTIVDLAIWFKPRVEQAIRKYLASEDSHRAIFDKILLDSLDEFYVSNPGFLEKAVIEIPQSALQRIGRHMKLKLTDVYSELPEQEPLPPSVKSLSDLSFHLDNSEKYDRAVRAALLKSISRDRESRETLAGFLDLSARKQ